MNVRHVSPSVPSEGHVTSGASASLTSAGCQLRGLRLASITTCMGRKVAALCSKTNEAARRGGCGWRSSPPARQAGFGLDSKTNEAARRGGCGWRPACTAGRLRPRKVNKQGSHRPPRSRLRLSWDEASVRTHGHTSSHGGGSR
eukprot:352223-Chlamydomonas_euryale.AAC.22